MVPGSTELFWRHGTVARCNGTIVQHHGRVSLAMLHYAPAMAFSSPHGLPPSAYYMRWSIRFKYLQWPSRLLMDCHSSSLMWPIFRRLAMPAIDHVAICGRSVLSHPGRRSLILGHFNEFTDKNRLYITWLTTWDHILILHPHQILFHDRLDKALCASSCPKRFHSGYRYQEMPCSESLRHKHPKQSACSAGTANTQTALQQLPRGSGPALWW